MRNAPRFVFRVASRADVIFQVNTAPPRSRQLDTQRNNTTITNNSHSQNINHINNDNNDNVYWDLETLNLYV